MLWDKLNNMGQTILWELQQVISNGQTNVNMFSNKKHEPFKHDSFLKPIDSPTLVLWHRAGVS